MMESFWLRLGSAIVGYPFLGVLAYEVVSHVSRRRLQLALLLCGLVLSLPFMLPEAAVVWRFFLALFALLFVARILEAATETAGCAKDLSTPGRFAVFLCSLGELRFVTRESERRESMRLGGFRLCRFGVKGAALLLLLAVATRWPTVTEQPFSLSLVCLLGAYLAATGLADLLTGALMLATGHRIEEVFQSPLLARSPIEFWSQRWNLLFRNAAYRLIFVPSGGRRRPWLGSALVFLFSAVAHEYLVISALGWSGGHMTAFFVLQGLATQLNASLRKRSRSRLPRPLGVTANWLWMLLTLPIFFVPILQILPPHSLRLW